MERQLLRWPDLTGAQDTLGRIVIGSKRSQSKRSHTRFTLYNPVNGDIVNMIAGRFAWSRDHKTIAILANGLREIIQRKVDVPFDRGAVATQILDTTLVLYEAGPRGTLWPRYWWPLHLSCPTHSWALNEVILMETLRPDVLVARKDKRQPATVEPMLPHDYNAPRPRWFDSLDDWVDQILALENQDG